MYFCDGKLIFGSHLQCVVFSVTRFFRNHTNMLFYLIFMKTVYFCESHDIIF